MTDVLDALANPPTVEDDGPAAPPAGWVKDRTTGEFRPPKRRGRKPLTPPPPPGEHEPLNRETPDTEPDSKSRGVNAKGVPRWKAGVIAKGMTKLYKRTGKIIKAMDRDIGIAVIESAEDCGEAWDDLARQNPRIRAFLLKLITGGSWMALLWAHAPIFLAIIMKDGIKKHIPFVKLLKATLEPDEEGTSEVSDLLGGLQGADVQDIIKLGQTLMQQTVPNWNGVPQTAGTEE